MGSTFIIFFITERSTFNARGEKCEIGCLFGERGGLFEECFAPDDDKSVEYCFCRMYFLFFCSGLCLFFLLSVSGSFLDMIPQGTCFCPLTEVLILPSAILNKSRPPPLGKYLGGGSVRETKMTLLDFGGFSLNFFMGTVTLGFLFMKSILLVNLCGMGFAVCLQYLHVQISPRPAGWIKPSGCHYCKF